MALVPHKITALAESDAQGTDGKNIVSGAVVSLYDTSGTVVTLFDDANGTNGSTTKQTDATGQVVVYVTPGEYDEEVNGSIKRRVQIGNKEITTEQLIDRVRPSQDGDVITTTGFSVAGDAGGAQWKATSTTGLTPSQAPTDRGAAELVDGSGRLWVLVHDGVFDVSKLGAIGDGLTPCNKVFQSTLDAIAEAGGGIMYIPSGTYRIANTIDGALQGQLAFTGDSITIMGTGDSSVIFHDDRPNEGRKDLFRIDDTENVTLQDFKILGTADTHFFDSASTNKSQNLSGGGNTNIRLINLTIEGVQYMATSFNTSTDVLVQGCRLINIPRDGFRFTGSKSVRILGNYAKNVADDVVAVHSLDLEADGVVDSVIVANNVFEHIQGIKLLGAKNVTVENNILRRCIRDCVRISNTSSVEGNVNMMNINIDNNIFLDIFDKFGTNTALQILGRPVTTTITGGIAGFTEEEYPYNYTNAIDDTGTPVMPIQKLNITNNTFARTLEATADYSDYGYGQFFDRVGGSSSYFQDEQITDSDFGVYYIRLKAPCQEVRIEGNNFSGTTLAPVRIVHDDFGLPLSYQHILIKNNVFRNMGQGSGAAIQLVDNEEGPTFPDSSNIDITGNTFDGDPYFVSGSHNSDNTWVGDESYVAIKQTPSTFLKGINVSGNTFKNVSHTGISLGRQTRVLSPNVCFADYVRLIDAANKGIRSLPLARENVIVKIDGDPTSQTYNQIEHWPESSASAGEFPLTGFWAYGHYIMNRAPSTISDPGTGTYIVTGWIKTSTNSDGSLTSPFPSGFVELRNYVQNIT